MNFAPPEVFQSQSDSESTGHGVHDVSRGGKISGKDTEMTAAQGGKYAEHKGVPCRRTGRVRKRTEKMIAADISLEAASEKHPRRGKRKAECQAGRSQRSVAMRTGPVCLTHASLLARALDPSLKKTLKKWHQLSDVLV